MIKVNILYTHATDIIFLKQHFSLKVFVQISNKSLWVEMFCFRKISVVYRSNMLIMNDLFIAYAWHGKIIVVTKSNHNKVKKNNFCM